MNTGLLILAYIKKAKVRQVWSRLANTGCKYKKTLKFILKKQRSAISLKSTCSRDIN